MACIAFDAPADRISPSRPIGATGRLATCDYFFIDRAELGGAMEREMESTGPVVWIVLEGQGVIHCEGAGPTAFTRGDTLLLPGRMRTARVKTVADSAWLEVRLPQCIQDASLSSV